MGLLEKALKYKNRINRKGSKTLMDRIAGPAETGPPASPAVSDADVLYLDRTDLTEVPRGGGGGQATGSGGRNAQPRRPSSWEDSGALLDNLALYELSKDILRAETTGELFDVILFSIMGQVGVSSSSIMLPMEDNPDEWEIIESRGVTINRDEMDFRPGRGILKEVITRREIVDIEDFKNNSSFSEDYYVYIAIDARLLVPIICGEEVMGVIALGNKLSAEDYTGEEKGFFNVIAEYSAFSYRALKFKALSESGSGPGSHIAAVDRMRGRVMAEERAGAIRTIIQDEFRAIGITGFAVFVREEASRDYSLFVCEPEDRLKLQDLQCYISGGAGLVREITRAESPVIFNDFRRSKTMVEIFTDSQLKGMTQCDLYTFVVEGRLAGFTMIYDMADGANPDTVHRRMMKFTDFMFPYIAIIRDIEYRGGMYIDTIEGVLNRIDDELANARDLNIPVTLVLLSIKNFKRYYALFGREKAKSIFVYFETFVRSRISDRDFSARFDRSKILITLPGKDRRYAVPLANTICAEMNRAFSTRDAQLLVTFLSAEFPADGADAHALLDAVN